jgi:hypothetical protein
MQQIINFEELKQKVIDIRSEQMAEETKRPEKQEESKYGKVRPSMAGIDELGDPMKKQDLVLTAELQNLLDGFDHFFVNTIAFNIEALAELICALAQLTVGALEHLKYSG